MTDKQIQIQYLLRRLRYKYKNEDDKYHTEILNNIMWRSYPIVYPDHKISQRKIVNAIDNRKKKKHRVNKYLLEMTEWYNELYFVTLTFADEYVNGCSETTLHRYAQRWLNENCRDYICNTDYGKKNGRLHFHAVVSFKEDVSAWEYGFSNRKKAKFVDDDKSRYRVSSYMIKLTNHATKLGTGKCFHKKEREDVDELPDWLA